MVPLRVVVDPNLLVSILIGKRVTGLKAIFHDPGFVVIVDENLIAEFDEMARRTKFRKYFPEALVDLIIDQLHYGGEVVDPPRTIERVCRDPDDDYLLALCKGARAKVLLTGDEDLLSMGSFGKTRILNARSFVREFLE